MILASSDIEPGSAENKNRRQRSIHREYPEFIAQLQSKSARRLLLNHERALIWKMVHEGVLEAAEAQHLIDSIETRMLKLREEENN
jgi:hypothetical protein